MKQARKRPGRSLLASLSSLPFFPAEQRSSLSMFRFFLGVARLDKSLLFHGLPQDGSS
jgi:hypothetical protein